MPQPPKIASVESHVMPSVESNLVFWQQQLDRLEADVGQSTATYTYPEWWSTEDFTPVQNIVPQLQEEGIDLSNVARYYELYSRQFALHATITGQDSYSHPLERTIGSLGESLIARAFAAEPTDGTLHEAMLADLESQAEVSSGVLTNELKVLQQAYGYNTLTELLGVGGDAYSVKLRSLLHRPNPLHWMRHHEEVRTLEDVWSDVQAAQRTWMSNAVTAATGMPAEEAADYVFSASRTYDTNCKHILSVLTKFDYFGVDRIRRLSGSTGIQGLEGYTVEQLERMEAFVDNPQAVSEKLAHHDVNVVLINRSGDHNGTLRDVAANFDDETGRTLFFEITSIRDIYRRMAALRKAGIRPSTLVLAAHSAPGQFSVSDARERGSKRRAIATVAGKRLVAMVNGGGGDLGPGETGYSMYGMAGMAKLVDSYMQPSRALDDAAADSGRKKIIFQACDAGTEVKVADLDENDHKVEIGKESIISRLGKDLVASRIKAESRINTDVDIYGAADGIQMHRTNLGVRYSSQPLNFGNSRIAMRAKRIRIERGKITQTEVDEIILRKAA